MVKLHFSDSYVIRWNAIFWFRYIMLLNLFRLFTRVYTFCFWYLCIVIANTNYHVIHNTLRLAKLASQYYQVSAINKTMKKWLRTCQDALNVLVQQWEVNHVPRNKRKVKKVRQFRLRTNCLFIVLFDIGEIWKHYAFNLWERSVSNTTTGAYSEYCKTSKMKCSVLQWLKWFWIRL